MNPLEEAAKVAWLKWVRENPSNQTGIDDSHLRPLWLEAFAEGASYGHDRATREALKWVKEAMNP